MTEDELAQKVAESIDWDCWSEEFSKALVHVVHAAILQRGPRAPTLQFAIGHLRKAVEAGE